MLLLFSSFVAIPLVLDPPDVAANRAPRVPFYRVRRVRLPRQRRR